MISQKKLEKLIKFNLLFIIVTIPAVMYLHLVMQGEEATEIWGSFINIDFYSYYKMIFFLTASFFLLILFLKYIDQNQLQPSRYHIPIIIYSILTVISAFAAEYKEIVIKGFPDRYENIFVLLGYMLLVVVVINIIRDKKSFKLILKALFISAFILAIHGVLQFYNYDLLATEFGRKLITPAGLEFFVDRLSFIGKRVIYSTMYNPNYVGSYGSMVGILALGLYTSSQKKNRLFISGILSTLLFAFLIGSRSRAGFMGFIAGTLIILFMQRQFLKVHWPRIIIIFTIFTLVFTTMNARGLDEIFSDVLFPKTEKEKYLEEKILPPITEVSSEAGELKLETAEAEFEIMMNSKQIKVLNKKPINVYNSSNEVKEVIFKGKQHLNHSFQINEQENSIIWNYGAKKAQFYYQDGQILMAGMHNNLYPLVEAESIGFEGYERLGSSRAYIWSRTLPLLKDTSFIGHGPDTYAMYFPQDDVIGKLKFFNNPEIIVDKPHNLYLQIAVNTGITSLLALLYIWGDYIISSFILFNNSDLSSWKNRLGIALMGAVAAYLTAGFFNDSVISVAPVFWILLGLGISINYLAKEDKF
ncbi:O-antigen ligase-like membrane protein [Halanaerobium saccharolyticum]|uniref:O-antigen ligase-like membrane protein n=1 Tax=Halanaerobium saccharolyticum TaxID=43595 RepID=A0A4R6LUC7_9FIRM|nr:O-antigen ligase family protein [Halanaerobium saccharolyticum]TDO92244.1 O-antigen ligase-like membrane protein [Halanaerobium saccharolyticum]